MRHADAGGNKKHILNGCRLDSSITSNGKKEAARKAWVYPHNHDAILVSPMKRARQTAAYFEKRLGLEAEVLDCLHEQDCGDWTGKSAALLKDKYPELFFDYSSGSKSHLFKSCPNGESWSELKKRSAKILKMLKKEYRDKDVLVIAHGVLILSFIENITKLRPPRLFSYKLNNLEYVSFIL